MHAADVQIPSLWSNFEPPSFELVNPSSALMPMTESGAKDEIAVVEGPYESY